MSDTSHTSAVPVDERRVSTPHGAIFVREAPGDGPAVAFDAEIAGLFANSTLHGVEQAGHYPQYDRPDIVAALLTQTLP